MRLYASSALIPFQSTPSVWRETTMAIDTSKKDLISIHSLRVEGDDRGLVQALTYIRDFNPLPPCGGRRA